MDSEKVNEILNILNDGGVEINLYLGHKKSNNKVTIVNPTIREPLKKKLLEITKTQIELCKNLAETEYNVVGSNDDTVEKASVNKYENYIKIITEEIAHPAVNFRFAQDNFDFFIYSFTLKKGEEEKKIIAFRRTKNMKFLRKGFIGNLIEGTFKKMEDSKLIGTDDLIDLFIYDDDIMILNHSSFESIFQLTDDLKNKAISVLSNQKFDNQIDRIADLKKDALKNRSYIKRLSKLDGQNNSTLFLEDLSKTKDVIEQFSLDIEVDVNKNKIMYSNVTQLGSFISLMQDAFYKTLIGDEKGIDERK